MSTTTTLATTTSAWSEPTTTFDTADTGPGVVFPVHALPAAIADHARSVAAATKTPIDLPASFVLAMVAAAARNTDVQVNADHREGVNLFVCAAAPKGSGKSGALAAVAKPLNELDAAVRVDPDDGLPDRLLASNASGASIVEVLAAAGGSAALISAEGDVLENITKSTPGLRTVVLKGYSNETIDHDRTRSAQTVNTLITRPYLTIATSPQPLFLGQALGNTRVVQQGTMDRFLICNPQPLTGTRDLANETPLDPEATRIYHELITSLALDSLTGSGRCLSISAEAAIIRGSVLQKIEDHMAPGGPLSGAVSGWASKLRCQTARVAGVLHLASGTAGNEIDASTMAAAIEVIQYYLAWARHVFQPAIPHAAVSLAGDILDRAQNSPPVFSQRELHRSLPHGYAAQDVAAALVVLAEHGCVRPVPTKTGSRGGRPANTWEWNPALLDQTSQSITLL